MRKDTARNDLRELIAALTALHRALLDAQADEFAADQLLEQRPSDLLALVVSHPRFAWLHRLSELVVDLEALADNADASPEVFASIAPVTNALLTGAGSAGSEFNARLQDLIQRSPEVAGALAQVRGALARIPGAQDGTSVELHERHVRAQAHGHRDG